MGQGWAVIFDRKHCEKERQIMGEKKMQDKKVIVTGSGIGIGREVALEFSRQGADVALHYCHNAEGAQSAVEEIRGWGGKAEAFKADFAVLKGR